jgi:hypothetical protein
MQNGVKMEFFLFGEILFFQKDAKMERCKEETHFVWWDGCLGLEI